MKHFLILLLCLGPALVSQAQYQPTSTFLTQPESAIDFVKAVADFHLRLEDQKDGGFYTFAGADGQPRFPQNRGFEDYSFKSLCAISRTAYAFGKAFQLTGEVKYLQAAQKALTYLNNYGWDQTYGGWYFTRDIDAQKSFGAPWNPEEKWTFQQEYALVGPTAMFEATAGTPTPYSEETTEMLAKGLKALDDYIWDSRSQYLGYFERAGENWSNPTGKGFTATIDGINTHTASLALMGYSDAIEERYLRLSENAEEYLAGNVNKSGIKLGFPENFNNNWEVKWGSTKTGIGHILKTAWCLSRASIFFDDAEFQQAADKILIQILDPSKKAIDHERGGPFLTLNWKTGEITDKRKNHWVMEQAFTSGLSNYYNTTEEEHQWAYLELADRAMGFFETHMLHPSLGISYPTTSQYGTPTQDDLADMFKAGFHDAELGYFIYLYTSAYYHGKTFDLYYYLKGEKGQTVQIAPLEMQAGALKLEAVQYQNTPYTAFEASSNTLKFPEAKEGVFKLTFRPQSKSNPVLATEQPPTLKVSPTVFNKTVRINSGNLETACFIDLNGRQYEAGITNAQRHSVIEAKEQLPPGILYLQVQKAGVLHRFKLIQQ
ncbi:AGE family epimerase/isomerase [Persicobacter diffluens]|uniref:N-acylglucosamine 2-epimerase n=1 Tax=Persicobacter diffluens TaxID=981 RepID=A0AAN4W2V7_9BACT|nr:hypothetical protein PEDI_48800 [Persicobacter diffluens]